MTDSIRILLCEDQTLMRQGLRTIYEDYVFDAIKAGAMGYLL
jgi:hypothetical protein